MLAGCAKEKEARPELLEPVNARIEVAQAEVRQLSNMTVYQAQVLPATEDLCFDINGYLYGIYVETGDMVEEGEVLATLVGENYDTINSLKDEISSMKSSNETRFTYLEANIKLAKLAGEDTAELELQLKDEKEMAALKLERKESKLAELEADDIGFTYIVAPRDCRVVAAFNGRAGAYVSAGTTLVALEAEEGIKLTCDFINQSKIDEMHDYYAIVHGREYRLEYVPYSKDTLKEMSSNGITPVSIFTLDNSDGEVKAGDYGVVVTVADCVDNVLAIPVNAVYSDSSGKFVYEIIDNARVKKSIVTGVSDSTYVEVIEGLKEGAKVYVKN